MSNRVEMERQGGELYREFRGGRGMADLSDRVKLLVRGADRIRYLNGQVTSNVMRLADGVAQPACVISAKGKLQGECWLSAGEEQEGIFIDGDAALRDTLPARLEKYVIADDVTVDDVSDSWRLVHLFAAQCEKTLPPGVRKVAAKRFGGDGTDVWIPAAFFDQTWESLKKDRVALTDSVLESIRIERGIPGWGCELDERTLPPEAGLERTHIDYQKGCYIGQEVISRLKSVGHVNRRLVGYLANDPSHLLTAPRTVTVEANGASAGEITSASWSFALERHIALGYLKRGMPTTGLVAHDDDGPAKAGIAVTVHELPFVS